MADEINTKDLSFEERKKLFLEELTELMAEYNVKLGAQITFPRYKVIPDDLKLALMVIAHHEPASEVYVNDNTGREEPHAN